MTKTPTPFLKPPLNKPSLKSEMLSILNNLNTMLLLNKLFTNLTTNPPPTKLTDNLNLMLFLKVLKELFTNNLNTFNNDYYYF